MLAWLNILIAFLQPPGLNVILLFVSLFYWIASKRGLALFFLITSTMLLYAFSIPLCTNKLMHYLENKYQAIKFENVIQDKTPKAIVVLSDGKWPNGNALMRILYAAKLANSTKLPILVSGKGKNLVNQDSEAADMAKSLAVDFNISGAIWIEGSSKNTMENAKFTKQILEKNGIHEIFLVTNAWHMSRAVQTFNKQAINVVAVPVLSDVENNKITLEQFIPSANDIVKSAIFFHEYFGALWYKMLHAINVD